jgi:hypothetical protein
MQKQLYTTHSEQLNGIVFIGYLFLMGPFLAPLRTNTSHKHLQYPPGFFLKKICICYTVISETG